MEHKKEETIFEKHKGNIYFRWGLTAVVVIVVSVVAAQLITKLPAFVDTVGKVLDTISAILYGLVIAYILDPIVERVVALVQPRLKFKKESSAETCARAIGVVVALICFFLILWALLAMMLPQLVESIVTIFNNLPVYYQTLMDWVNGLIDHNETVAAIASTFMGNAYTWFEDFLQNDIMPKLNTWITTLTSGVVSVFQALLDFVVGIIVSVYFMMGKKKLVAQGKKVLYAVLGRKKGGYVSNVCTFANHAFGGFIGGKIVDSAIIGVLCFIGTSLLKMPYALLISVIVGATNVIPFFGPFLGAIPSALLLLVIDPLSCVYFVIFVFLLQQLDGNVIGPLILGDATGLSSIWVVFSILLFGGLWGVVGMIIAVPTFAVLYRIITDVIYRLLRKRELSTDTTDYEDWNYPPRSTEGQFALVESKRKQLFRKKKTGEETPAEADEAPEELPAEEKDA